MWGQIQSRQGVGNLQLFWYSYSFTIKASQTLIADLHPAASVPMNAEKQPTWTNDCWKPNGILNPQLRCCPKGASGLCFWWALSCDKSHVPPKGSLPPPHDKCWVGESKMLPSGKHLRVLLSVEGRRSRRVHQSRFSATSSR